MPCVNMPYMCKVGHDFSINTPLYILGMHQANRGDGKDSCAFQLSHTRSAKICNVDRPWFFCLVLINRISPLSIHEGRKKCLLLILPFLPLSANPTAGGEDPAVPGAVSELCHPQSNQRGQPQTSGQIPVSPLAQHGPSRSTPPATSSSNNHRHRGGRGGCSCIQTECQ